jgi:hypothetical protein
MEHQLKTQHNTNSHISNQLQSIKVSKPSRVKLERV